MFWTFLLGLFIGFTLCAFIKVGDVDDDDKFQDREL